MSDLPNLPDLTPEQQQQLSSLVISTIKAHPWVAWVLVVAVLMVGIGFIIGVSTDLIDPDKLTTVRGRAAYRIGRRFGLFFRDLPKDLKQLWTGREE